MAVPGLAQDTGDGGAERVSTLDRLVVTAGRDERSLASVAQSVTVIDRFEIDKVRAMSTGTADIVSRLVPGYVPDNQTVSGASESFRGRDVLIMVDGVPRNTPLRDNSRILSLIDPEIIERIEVVNGASSLYGAGATGGTINIITRRGEGAAPRVTVRTGVTAFTEDAGESAAPEASVSVEGRRGGFDYFLSASGERTRRTYDGDGREMASDAMLGQGGGDRTTSGNFYGALGYETGARRFGLTLDWTHAEQEPDWLTDYTTDPVSPDFQSPYRGETLEEDSRYLTATYGDADFALGDLEVKAFYNHIDKRSPFTELSAVNSIAYFSGDFSQPTADFNQSALQSDRYGLNVTVNTPVDLPTDGSRLTWGLDYVYDETEQTLTNGADAIAPMNQHAVAAYAQTEIPVTARFRLQGGVRFDQFFLEVEGFDRPAAVTFPASSATNLYPEIRVSGGSFDYNAATFNAGAVLDVTGDLQGFGNFSQGYTLTDIGAFTRRAGVNTRGEICDAYGALAAAFGCSGTPDFAISYADIAPEPQLVNTFETGLRGDWGRYRGEISAFLSTSEDGVNYDVAANRVSQQEERIWGIEASGAYDIDDMFTLGGVIGYREGKYDADQDGDIEDGEYLPNNRIPSPVSGIAYLDGYFDHGIIGRGEVEFFSGRDRIQGEELGGAVLVNLSVSKTFDHGGELSLAVRNLLDTGYENPSATATRGATVPGLGRAVFVGYSMTF